MYQVPTPTARVILILDTVFIKTEVTEGRQICIFIPDIPNDFNKILATYAEIAAAVLFVQANIITTF